MLFLKLFLIFTKIGTFNFGGGYANHDAKYTAQAIQYLKEVKAQRAAGKVLERTYLAPFYAHATIEPPAAIAHYQGDGICEIWAPTQHPQWARQAVATALDLDLDKVKMNVTLLGGGFGRKSKPDFVVEAAILSKAAKSPVKVQWTREDDLHFDFFHSHSAQRIKATIDKDGNFTGWNHHTVFPAIGAVSPPHGLQDARNEPPVPPLTTPFIIFSVSYATFSFITSFEYPSSL